MLTSLPKVCYSIYTQKQTQGCLILLFDEKSVKCLKCEQPEFKKLFDTKYLKFMGIPSFE